MPIIDDRTTNRNYAKPNALNNLSDDVTRIRSALDEIDASIVVSDVTGIAGADRITNIVSLTQAEYNAITPNASTFYVII
jgi:hypothetical protein